LALGEAAATREPGGPQGTVDAVWLILQRLEDLRRGYDDLRGDFRTLRSEINQDLGDLHAELQAVRKELKADIDSVRTWSLGLLLLAILGLLAKLLLPGG
jgi:hypothetical protein